MTAVTSKAKSAKQQERGKERRRQIVAATRELLGHVTVDELTLSDIAKKAEIPISSLYHFYPNVTEVYRDLAEQLTDDFADCLQLLFQEPLPPTWQGFLELFVETAAELYEADKSATQLYLSGKAPAIVWAEGRAGDQKIVDMLLAELSTIFELPKLPNIKDVIFNTLEIVDLFFCLSVAKHNRINDEAIAEAKRAGKAYLRTYFPDTLPLVMADA